MGFLIDTNIGIAIERGRLNATDIHAITRQTPIYVSPVNLAEIRFGIDLMADAKQKHRAMATLRRMRRKPLLRIGAETAEVFGALAARLAKPGRGHGYPPESENTIASGSAGRMSSVSISPRTTP